MTLQAGEDLPSDPVTCIVSATACGCALFAAPRATGKDKQIGIWDASLRFRWLSTVILLLQCCAIKGQAPTIIQKYDLSQFSKVHLTPVINNVIVERKTLELVTEHGSDAAAASATLHCGAFADKMVRAAPCMCYKR